MNSIFISYRREDASGHAGRLFDRLKDRFGDDHVFMDVTDLHPGVDFATEIERALESSDVVLAVIGPGWLDARGARGRRLDEPDDFVRREIAIALERGAKLIPVLVRGARMPAAARLPEPLRDLARRQAVELSDSRWDTDVRQLVDALEPQADAERGPSSSRPAFARRSFVLLAVVVVVLAVLALRVPMLKEESPVDQPPDRTVPRGDAPPVAASRSALDLPSPAEVRFRTASGEMRYTILAIAAEPAPGGRERLELLVRLVNRGDAGANFWDDSFALLADGTRYEPVSRLNEVVPSFATQEGRLEFIVPAGLDAAALEISLGENETTSIPLRLEARAPLVATSETDEFGRRRPVRVVDAIALPVALQAGQRVRAGRVTFELTSATFERDTTERAALVLVVRCSVPPEGSPVNYWSRSVRLVVDGAPIAPVNAINEIVGPGESKDATFVFGLEALPASLALEFRDGGAMASLPLDLPTR